jgi:hypothetical protein
MSILDKHAKGNYTIAAKKWIIGSKVVNDAGEDLGKIEDLVIDSRNSRVAYAILSFGGFLGVGDSHFPIPWEAIDFNAAEHYATLSINKDRLKNAPGFDKDNWPDMSDISWGGEIHSHYGFKPYWEDQDSGL